MNTIKAEQQVEVKMREFFEKSSLVTKLNFKLISIDEIDQNNSLKRIVATATNRAGIFLNITYLLNKEELHTVISNPNKKGIFVAEYIEYKGDLNQAKEFSRQSNEPIDLYLARYMSLLANAFSNEMKGIVDGSEWEEIPNNFISKKVGWFYK